MINAYKIGVELALSNDIARQVIAIARQFEELNSVIKSAHGNMGDLISDAERVARAGREAAEAWRDVASAMNRASGAPPGGRGSGGSSLPALAAGTAAGAALAAPGGGGGWGGGGGGGPPLLTGPGGGGGRGPISLPPLATGSGMSGHQYAMAAAGYGFLGYGILDFQRSTLDAAGDVSHLRAMLIAQGVSPGEADEAVSEARKVARATPGLTTEQALTSAVDLKSVLGGTANNPASMYPALSALPAFGQTMAVLNAIGTKSGDPTFAAAKAQEILGHLVDEKTGGVSSEELQKHLDATARVAVATNMRVAPQDYLGFVKQARIAGLSLDDQALYGYIPALIMELGGNRAGTGAAAMFRQFSAGTMTDAKFEQLQKLGIVDKSAKWSHGQVADMSHHLTNYSQFAADPVKWVWDTIIPALDKAGIHGRANQSREVANFASTATGGGFIAEIIAQAVSMQKEAANIGSAQTGTEALKTLVSQDFNLQLSAFNASFHNLLTDLGSPMLEDAARALRALTGAVDGLGKFAHDNPDVARHIGEVATGFAALAVGTAAYSGIMFVGGPMLKLATGLASFATALPGVSTINAAIEFLARFSGITTFLMTLLHSSPTNGGEDDLLRRYHDATPEDRKKMMDPNFHHSSFELPFGYGDGKPVIQTVVYLDGKVLAKTVSTEQARALELPRSGTSRFDTRRTPSFPSNTVDT